MGGALGENCWFGLEAQKKIKNAAGPFRRCGGGGLASLLASKADPNSARHIADAKLVLPRVHSDARCSKNALFPTAGAILLVGGL